MHWGMSNKLKEMKYINEVNESWSVSAILLQSCYFVFPSQTAVKSGGSQKDLVFAINIEKKKNLHAK